MNPPMEGGCRCGRVRFRIDTPPMLAMACHCIGCQRMSGSAFSTTIAVATDGFVVTQGDTVTGGIHGDHLHHHHCDWCKGWLFTRISPGRGFVNVRATMLDDPRWFVPFIETRTDEALPWTTTPATHSYAGFPPMEEFPVLLAEYAAMRAG